MVKLALLFLSLLFAAANVEDPYVLVGSDAVQRQSHLEAHRSRRRHSQRTTQSRRQGNVRGGALELLATMDSFKREASMWNTNTDRPTLATGHYIILPIWWDGSPTNNLADIDRINQFMQEVVDYFKSKSWNKHTLSWTVLDQRVLPSVTTTNANFDNSAEAARAIVNAEFTQFQDYTGIMLMYDYASQGPLSTNGGYGDVNGKRHCLCVCLSVRPR